MCREESFDDYKLIYVFCSLMLLVINVQNLNIGDLLTINGALVGFVDGIYTLKSIHIHMPNGVGDPAKRGVSARDRKHHRRKPPPQLSKFIT
ncbi:hypothetical protein L1887_12603 [Cichorium endivia]|nr:hypothetical protein L1887_12603 [Cichorium endivia]